MASIDSYILHSHKTLQESVLIEIAQVLKTEKIVKDEAVKFSHTDENKWPHIYHFITDRNTNE